MVEKNYVHISCSSRNMQWKNTVKYRTEPNRTLLIQNISDHSQVSYDNKCIILKQFACDFLQQSDIHVHNSYRMLGQEECTVVLSKKHRSAFAKFRCGVAPLRILVIGRYKNLEVGDRTCPFCGKVEDEKHVILECNV